MPDVSVGPGVQDAGRPRAWCCEGGDHAAGGREQDAEEQSERGAEQGPRGFGEEV